MKKAIDSSIRSRLSRCLFQVSLSLLVITLIYWAVATRVGSDFGGLDGEIKPFPTASIVTQHHEFGWVIDSRTLLICHFANPAGDALPLISPHGFMPALFQHLTTDWEYSGSVHEPYVVARLTTYHSVSNLTGSPVIVQFLYIPMWRVLVAFAIWPALVGVGVGWRKLRNARSARRVFRRRRRRNAMGRCTCGYDLRHSHARCPECGRAFRRVPVPIPA